MPSEKYAGYAFLYAYNLIGAAEGDYIKIHTYPVYIFFDFYSKQHYLMIFIEMLYAVNKERIVLLYVQYNFIPIKVKSRRAVYTLMHIFSL